MIGISRGKARPDGSTCGTAAASARWGRLALVLWLLAMVATAVAVLLSGLHALIDLQVYRTGGQAWLSDVRLYAEGFPAPLSGPALPFTYPPIAAVLFSLFALLPWPAAIVVFTLLGLAGLSLTALAVARRTHRRRELAVLVGLAVAVAALAVEPVRQTLSFGQINLILMGLVAADCLVSRTRWPRGLLIGFAAAIKLTPVIFVLFFLARRQWRPMAVALAAFAAFGLLGWVLAPEDTAQYWFGALLDPGRVGGLAYATNQSLRGVLHRFGLAEGAETITWMLLSLCLLMCIRDEVTALLAVAVAGLLVSPVSWSHHWVWIVPALVPLTLVLWRGRWLARGAGALVVLVFVVGPHWLLPRENDRELGWAWWQHLIGDSYVLVGLALLVLAAFVDRWYLLTRPVTPAPTEDTDDTTAEPPTGEHQLVGQGEQR